MIGRLLAQLRLATILLAAASLAVPFGLGEAVVLKDGFPKRANYFLSWEMTDSQAADLSKWDLVILDMEQQVKNPDKILEMRRLNPHLVILAYITVQELRDDIPQLAPFVPMRATLLQGVKDAWWLRTPEGRKVGWWPGTTMLNVTAAAPTADGQAWSGYLSDFIATKILGSGLWDGVFFDNTWDSLADKVGNNLDINNDGRAESRETIDTSYRQGLNNFFVQVRQKSGGQYLLMGIDGEIYTGLNGMLFENFPQARGWSTVMRDYSEFSTRSSVQPAWGMLNANTNNAGASDDYKQMRFGLASSLLANGYYSFDYGDRDHGQTWWYDEYDFNLGEPVSGPLLTRNGATGFGRRGLWRRDFKNGVVLVNSGDTSETVDLNAEFEKLKGIQDASTNDGSIVSSVTVPSGDGLVLLRPIDKLTATVVSNGSFVRLYNQSGRQLRNGFFSYDSRWRGGQTLYSGDSYAVTAAGGQITVYSGEDPTASFYPFGAKFKGGLSLAVGDLANDGQLKIVVGQASGGGQVKVFDLAGREELSFAALPVGSRAGVNVALGDLNGAGPAEIIVGVGSGSGQIKIFSNRGKLVSAGWPAFGRNYRGGVNVASGDVNGDGRDEVVAGAATGRPDIKIFDQRGRQLGAAFLGASAKVKKGIRVACADVDGDGVSEIVSYSNEVFTTALR